MSSCFSPGETLRGEGHAAPFTERAAHPIDAAEGEIFVDVGPGVGGELLPFQEGVQLGPGPGGFGHALGEVVAEEQRGEVADGAADGGQVADHVPAEARPDALDPEGVTRALDGGALVDVGEKWSEGSGQARLLRCSRQAGCCRHAACNTADMPPGKPLDDCLRPTPPLHFRIHSKPHLFLRSAPSEIHCIRSVAR